MPGGISCRSTPPNSPRFDLQPSASIDTLSSVCRPSAPYSPLLLLLLLLFFFSIVQPGRAGAASPTQTEFYDDIGPRPGPSPQHQRTDERAKGPTNEATSEGLGRAPLRPVPSVLLHPPSALNATPRTMPGILPMKVIKVGSAAQSRIAQACDRCRSKKIRCDGVRPTCSQCAAVGFECRTSDKLSRRAFPRGYTESLEERVRALESELRELKDQLDERDEKIDMYSQMRSVASPAAQTERTSRSVDAAVESRRRSSTDEVVRVQDAPRLFDGALSEPLFAGSSSGRVFVGACGPPRPRGFPAPPRGAAFWGGAPPPPQCETEMIIAGVREAGRRLTGLVLDLDVFQRKLQASGRSSADVKAETLLDHPRTFPPPSSSSFSTPSSPVASPGARRGSNVPPRLVSDQLINIYFQEWAPLFPVLHRPTFLASYEKFCATPDPIKDQHTLAQLYLVFGVAAVAAEVRRWAPFSRSMKTTG